MSLLGTSTSLRSVTGCLVAGSGDPHPNAIMFVGPSQVARPQPGLGHHK